MELIQAYIWTGIIIFMRVGAILMLAPVIGENGVPARMRLAVAFLTTCVAAPVLKPIMPVAPSDLASLVEIIIPELLTGLMIGGAARILMSAVHVMGQIGALQSGLAFAQFLDPSQGTPNATLGVFAGLVALATVLAGNFHHLFFMAATESYTRFPPGSMPPLQDGLDLIVSAVATAFRLGTQMAAPIIIFGLVFNAALGIMARLVPQAQVFFIALGPSIILSLFIFMASLGTVMLVFADGLGHFFTDFL